MRGWARVGGIPAELVERDESARALGGVEPRRRSLWAFGALCCGFMGARALVEAGVGPSSAAWFGVCQALLAGALVCRSWRCRVTLWVAVAVFAGGWYTQRFGPGQSDRIDVVLSDVGGSGPLLVRVEGVVLETPRVVTPATGVLGRFARAPSSSVFTLGVRSVEMSDGERRASGSLRVSVRDTGRAVVRAGNRVKISGEYRPIGSPMNPGEPDRRLLALQEGVVGRLVTSAWSLVEVSERGPPGGAGARLVAWARARAGGAIHLANDDSERTGGRALLRAMLLGEREPGSEEVDSAFRRIGLVHLVAISGFNLTLLAWAGSLVFRLAADRARLESVGVALLIALYLLIVPAESPVLRAGVSVLVFLLTEALGRRYDRLTILGWTACAVLLWKPLDLWSLGFQLSFGIVGVLLWTGSRTEERLFGVPLRGVVSVGVPIGCRPGLLPRAWRTVAGPIGRWVRPAWSASLLAWGTATPVILYHTGVLSPWAPVTGLIALPLASATLCAGYLALLVGFVWPGAGHALAEPALASAELLVKLVRAMDAMPASSMTLPRVSLWWTLATLAAVLYVFRRGGRRDPWTWAIACVLGGWLGGEVLLAPRLGSGTLMRVDTLSVGDGTCHMVRSGREAMLWDCGSSHPGMGLREIPRSVRALGAGRVRSALVTHANLDHFICLPDVVGPLGIERVYVTGVLLEEAETKPGGAADALVDALRDKGVEVMPLARGDTFRLGNVTCEILSPQAGSHPREVNDTSLVGCFAAGERRVLMTGDIGPEAIARVREALGDRRVDVLEVPHHGSAKAESIAFVHAIDPAVVLQSTGPQRLGDRRWDGVRGERWWGVTAGDGALWVEVGSDGALRAGTTRRR